MIYYIYNQWPVGTTEESISAYKFIQCLSSTIKEPVVKMSSSFIKNIIFNGENILDELALHRNVILLYDPKDREFNLWVNTLLKHYNGNKIAVILPKHDLKVEELDSSWKKITWSANIKDAMLSHFLFQKELELPSSEEYDLLYLDLDEHKDLIYADSCKEVIFGQKLSSSKILSTLGFSLNTENMNLSPNIEGLSYLTDVASYISNCKEFYYPSFKNKSFGQYLYLAKHYQKKFHTDNMHGWSASLSYLSLEDSIDHLLL